MKTTIGTFCSLLLIMVLLSCRIVTGQVFQFQPYHDMEVIKNGRNLAHPTIGGLAAPQFAEIDLNNDGIEDLIVFERLDNKVMPFIRRIENGVLNLQYAPDYSYLFPEMLDWLILADFNLDGKKDLFTGSNGGIKVYENIGNNRPAFRLRTNLLDAWWEFGFRAGILVLRLDRPGIADLDGDGDLDVISFDNFEIGKVNYYRNMSMERYGHADSLDFVVASRCWGYFEEDQFSSNILLGLDSGCFRPVPLPNVVSRIQHLGSTITPINANRDTLMDILLGDVEMTHLKYLQNGGTQRKAIITQVFDSFPAYDTTSFIPIFPAGYLVDVNLDGKKDLIVATNDFTEARLTDHVWYYQNQSSTPLDSFKLVTRNFLVEDILQYYTNAAPLAVDVDNDGREDLLISFENGQYKGVIHYYRNTGTTIQPAFTLIDTLFLRTDTLNQRFLRLAKGDLNGSGRADLLIGTLNGNLIHYENTGSSAIPGFVLRSLQYQGLLPGQGPAPEIADINRDGKPDLFIGTREGKIQYYQNNGTASAPSFTLVNGQLGNVNTAEFFTGFAVPRIADFNNDGVLDLVVGSERGRLFFFPSIEQSMTAPFLNRSVALFWPQVGIYDSTRLGLYVTPTVMQLNGDTLVDLLVGSFRGGIQAFRNTQFAVSVPGIEMQVPMLRVFPNPSSAGQFNVQLDENQASMRRLSLYDVQGRLIRQFDADYDSRFEQISTEARGLLLLRVELTDGRVVHRKLLAVQ
jgi:hypothetical protein